MIKITRPKIHREVPASETQHSMLSRASRESAAKGREGRACKGRQPEVVFSFESVLSSHEQPTSKHSDSRQGGGNTNSDPECRHITNRLSFSRRAYYISFFTLLAFCENFSN